MIPTIISDNCWALGVYKKLNVRYESPFVGLFIHTPDYIRMLEDLENYLKEDITFIKFNESKYQSQQYDGVIGKLGDVELFFAHYKSKDEVQEQWNKRKERINFDNLIVKFGKIYCRNYFEYPNFDELLDRFYKLKYPIKYSFTSDKYLYDGNFQIKPEHVCDCFKKGIDFEGYGIKI